MSILQLVFSLDKTIEGNNSILENMSILTDIATKETTYNCRQQTKELSLRDQIIIIHIAAISFVPL